MQRGAGQQQPAEGVEVQERLPLLGHVVLDVVGFVENHVVPLLALEHVVIREDDLIGGDTHMEAIQFGPSYAQLLALLGRTEIREDLECGAEALELALPVNDAGSGNDDEMRAPNACNRTPHMSSTSD